MGLTVADGKVCGVRTDAGDLTADAYVVALGNASASFVRPIGIRLHIYPVKGYSVTIPVNEGHVAPRMGGVDESTLLGFSRLGDRLRLTSIAEFSGDAPGHRPSDFTPLVKSAQDLFPQGGDYSRPSYWTGFRPMTPEGPPLICQARYPNLYLNTGHGHLGWTISSGSARVLADLVAGRKPDVDISGLPAC
jgi:D-amino-acid dehydrogenase